MLESGNVIFVIVYLVSTSVALWIFWRFLQFVPAVLARYLIIIPAIFIAFTPATELLQNGYYAPAIAALALEFIDQGFSGAMPYTMVLVESIIVSLIVALALYWFFQKREPGEKKNDKVSENVDQKANRDLAMGDH